MKSILIVQENGRHAKNREFRECYSLQRAFRHLGLDAEIWGLGHSNFNHSLDALVSKCDAVLVLENYDSGWLPQLSAITKPKIFWCIDAHMGQERYVEMAKRHRFDIVFNSTEQYVTKFADYTHKSDWLPNAYDHFLIQPLPKVSKNIPIGFCGNILNREEWLRHLKGKWGLKHDEMVIGPDMVEAVNRYQIHWNRNIANDINYRTFETLGCRTFLLTNPTQGLDRLFQIGKHLETYLNREELDSKIKYYLEHPSEREHIADSGYQHVIRHHTYLNRARTICDSLGFSSHCNIDTNQGHTAKIRSQDMTNPNSLHDTARNVFRIGEWLSTYASLNTNKGDVAQDFGGSAIRKPLFDWVLSNLPPTKTILELGSGQGSTKNFSRFYQMYSVEDKAQFVGLFESRYIHAPIVDGWYDTQVLRERLPAHYDMLLVDGPTGEGNRWGFLKHIDMFNTSVPLVFDDTGRKAENDMMHEVARLLKKKVYQDPRYEFFGVVM